MNVLLTIYSVLMNSFTAGNTCDDIDDIDDAEGCIFTQNLVCAFPLRMNA